MKGWVVLLAIIAMVSLGAAGFYFSKTILSTKEVERLLEENRELEERIHALTTRIDSLTFAMTGDSSGLAQPDTAEVSLFTDIHQEFAQAFPELMADKLLRVESTSAGIRAILSDSILFEADEDSLTEKGEDILLRVAEAFMHAEGRGMRVTAGVDSSADGELAAMRVLNIVNLLEKKAGVLDISSQAVGTPIPGENLGSESGMRTSGSSRIEILLLADSAGEQKERSETSPDRAETPADSLKQPDDGSAGTPQ